MTNYTELLKIIKQACNESVEANKPLNICFGKVTSNKPLKILVDQKILLTDAQLILCRNVTDYEAEINIELEETEETTSTSKSHTHTISEGTISATTVINDKHKHEIKGDKKITFKNALKKDDLVILLRQQGGQKYIVIDRVG